MKLFPGFPKGLIVAGPKVRASIKIMDSFALSLPSINIDIFLIGSISGKEVRIGLITTRHVISLEDTSGSISVLTDA
jgi:hypothetical protein